MMNRFVIKRVKNEKYGSLGRLDITKIYILKDVVIFSHFSTVQGKYFLTSHKIKFGRGPVERLIDFASL